MGDCPISEIRKHVPCTITTTPATNHKKQTQTSGIGDRRKLVEITSSRASSKIQNTQQKNRNENREKNGKPSGKQARSKPRYGAVVIRVQYTKPRDGTGSTGLIAAAGRPSAVLCCSLFHSTRMHRSWTQRRASVGPCGIGTSGRLSNLSQRCTEDHWASAWADLWTNLWA